MIRKYDFKLGDIVYYDGIDKLYDYHYPYKLMYGNTPFFFAIEDKTGRIHYLGKDFIDTHFLPEEAYRKKYNISSKTDDASKNNDLENSDIAYYTGNETDELKNNKPYEVNYYNPYAKTITIGSKVYDSDDFISEEEYEDSKIYAVNLGFYKTTSKIGQNKGDAEIKLQIYKDTKSNKLYWHAPYTSLEFYRTYIKLENPPGSYLRIDLKNNKNLGWCMYIYYHRKTKDKSADNNSITLKFFNESKVLVYLSMLIKNKIEENNSNSAPY